MRVTLFRTRPLAVVAFAALLLGANLEPIVGTVREAALHQETSLAAPPSAPHMTGSPVVTSAQHERSSALDGCGTSGDHCAHAHGPALAVTGAPRPVVTRGDAMTGAVVSSSSVPSSPPSPPPNS